MMVEKPALESRLLYSLPLEPEKRLKRYAVASAVSCWLLVPVFGVVLSALYQEPILNWWGGWVCALVSTILLISFNLWAPLIRRADAFYVVGGIVRLPMFLLYLITGIALVGAILPVLSARWVFGGFVAGLALLPSAFIRRRTSIRQSLENGYLRRSLNRVEAAWDPKFDMDHVLRDPRAMRPGLFWRLAFWIGPAIGMSLADALGRVSALLVAGVLAISVGYGSLLAVVSHDVALVLELRRLERELGKPIRLAA